MTTLLERHMEKLEAAENAEAEVYKAGITWAPLMRTANDAMARLRIAERAIQDADAEINRHLNAVTESDVEFGNALHRLRNAGKLTREEIGEGDVKRIRDLLGAVAKLERAKKEAGEARQRTTDAHTKANLQYQKVLFALDALRPQISGEQYAAVARAFEDARKEPDRVGDSCQTRLEALKA
jgi:hypothetical protein